MGQASKQLFESAVAPHFSALYRAAYRLTGGRQDAEDLVQEVCPGVRADRSRDGVGQCSAFEPHFAAWAQTRTEEIHVVRVPAYWGRNAALHARAFYAAELLGIGDAVHAAFFNELHVAKRSLDTEDALAVFFETFGVDNARFRRVLNSDAVTALAAGAEQLVRQYQVTGTPSLIVNGEFVTGGAMADSYENLIEIVDELTSRQAACARAAERSNCRVRAAGMPLR